MRECGKLAVAQVRPTLGDIAHNAEKHMEWITKARDRGAQLVVFPELGLTGYQVQDLTLEVARRLDDPEIVRVIDASRGIDTVFSFVEESDEHLFYVAAVYAKDGEVAAVHRKAYLPTYGMFDEGRYFARGNRFAAFSGRFGRTGMLICEDAWHVTSPYLLALDGASLLLVPSSSPARSVGDQDRFGSQSFWRQLLQVYARLFGAYVVFANRVGFEDGVNFFGGSFVLTPDGEFAADGPVLEEALLLADVDMRAVRRVRYTTPMLRDERMDLVRAELDRIRAGNGGVQG
ncbi:nitrilase-related carbon-nitrogen hydrolase [Alicyclobacillus kakegawensis]|uniref:nitrilase-related carbon-nitrogen hydrolase n=1 Tax=Alicyclobacillus kakegawensis TaxID=392012 RepID=UPI00083061D7|nr:nitrilase-related carbon-nitrogen hydrolase [Alicyclobacillus kakegawensis]